ncbi:PREDICTED: aspartyl protease UND-like [Tarenaya hassleriana]|uniref:aspartyl protease UND-like n=1 Tax=Tarenaya hassleriana TaxID=28532 RepID=UPI00053C3BBB|nr:PREDICTED: aspartyl protease UND-like [Tarenaya hassleriana]
MDISFVSLLCMAFSSLLLLMIQSKTEAGMVVKLLHSNSFNNDVTHDAVSPVMSRRRRSISYYATISIGDPPVPHLLQIDTTSALLWLQCRPCSHCYRQRYPIFDPEISYTYKNQPCEPSYTYPILVPDEKTISCTYTDEYGSSGTLATETLTFQTTYGDVVSTLDDVVFGCGHDNYGNLANGLSGILGLSHNNLSIIHRFGSRFSYCFGNASDSSYTDSILALGEDEAVIMGDKTPLEIFRGLYYVTLEGISIGEIMLAIEPSVFQRKIDGRHGTLIDTGSTLVYLFREAYEPVGKEIRNVLEKKFMKTRLHSRRLMCYHGNIRRDLTGFPVLTFHFSGGAELSMDKESLFFMNGPDTFCLSIALAKNMLDANIIGAVAQQFYNVGYDLQALVVSFHKIDCSVL